MPKFIDLTDKVFGRLTVVSLGAKSPNGRNRWNCLCICGRAALVGVSDLINGHTISCGCFHQERLVEEKLTHGGVGTDEYRIWCLMKDRCYNPNAKKRYRYGGRGIEVCDRWRDDFAAFLADMGPRPSREFSIDRIDNNKGYGPDNCRWATAKQQSRNTRRNRVVQVGDLVGIIPVVAEQLGIPADTLKMRARRGSYGTHYVDR